jgi:hypothetical protein
MGYFRLLACKNCQVIVNVDVTISGRGGSRGGALYRKRSQSIKKRVFHRMKTRLGRRDVAR